MIAILGSLIGFLSSGLPNLFRFFQDKVDKQHELALLNLQLEIAKLNLQQGLDRMELSAEAKEYNALYSTFKSGVSWVDALNGTVRPFLAYAFFILYATVKYMQFKALGTDAPISVHLDILWTDNDNIIFSAITSFYFGSRYFDKK